MPNAFNDSLNKIIGEGLPSTAQSHLLAGPVVFWVSMQEIWEYREIKKCFSPPEGLPGLNILWLLFFSPTTGTAKSLPFPHVCVRKHKCVAQQWTSKFTLQMDVLSPLFQFRDSLGVTAPTPRSTITPWVPLLQGNAPAKRRSCKVPRGKLLLHWMNRKYTHLQVVAVTSSQVSLRRRQPRIRQAQNKAPKIVESIGFHFSFVKEDTSVFFSSSCSSH